MDIYTFPLEKMPEIPKEAMFPGAPWTHQLELTKHHNFIKQFVDQNNIGRFGFSSARTTYPSYIVFKKNSETFGLIEIVNFDSLNIYFN